MATCECLLDPCKVICLVLNRWKSSGVYRRVKLKLPVYVIEKNTFPGPSFNNTRLYKTITDNLFLVHRILRFIWEIVIENFSNATKTNSGVWFSTITHALQLLFLFLLFFRVLLLVGQFLRVFFLVRKPQLFTRDNSKLLR